MMVAACRREYLDAMGVQLWVERANDAALPEPVLNAVPNENVSLYCEGPEQAPLLIVGGFPTQQNEQQVRPFTGQALKLLEQMLLASGLHTTAHQLILSVDVPVAGDATLNKKQLARCRAQLVQQINDVSPQVVFVLGEMSAQSLLKSSATLGQLTGASQRVDDLHAAIIASPDLDYLMRQPSAKKQAWADIQRVKVLLK